MAALGRVYRPQHSTGMWRALRGAIGRLTGRPGAAPAPAPVRSFDEVMSAVHQDLLKAGQRAAASATAVREPLDLGSTFKSKTRQELRKMADAALHGQGEAQNDERAAALYTAAAMKGDTDSAYSMAVMLLQGRGVPEKDPAKAQELLTDLAEKAQHPWACFTLATLVSQANYRRRTSGEKEAMERCVRLLTTAAKGGVAPAALNLANAHFTGLGTEVDESAGLTWLRAAARMGDPIALTQLGQRFTEGIAVEQDATRGFKLYLLAAESGYPEALHNVGVAFLLAAGAPQSDVRAREFFELAASKGFQPSCVNLATLLQQGRGGPQDLPRALALLQGALKVRPSPPLAEQVEHVQGLLQSAEAAEEELQHGVREREALLVAVRGRGGRVAPPDAEGLPGTPVPGDQRATPAQRQEAVQAAVDGPGQQVLVFESAPDDGEAEATVSLELKLLRPEAAQDVLRAVNGTDMSPAALLGALRPFIDAGKVELVKSSKVRHAVPAPER